MIILYQLSLLIPVHKNRYFSSSVNKLAIEKSINAKVVECANGTTITRMVFGQEVLSQDKISFAFDIATSCNKDVAKRFGKDDCDVDIYWSNPIFSKIKEINKATVDFIKQDTIVISHGNEKKVLEFGDGQPVWLNIFDENKELTIEGGVINKIIPMLIGVLKRTHKPLSRVGFVKVRDPNFKHVIYLFTLSFWHNSYGEAEKKCVDEFGGEDHILRDLAAQQRKQLVK